MVGQGSPQTEKNNLQPRSGSRRRLIAIERVFGNGLPRAVFHSRAVPFLWLICVIMPGGWSGYWHAIASAQHPDSAFSDGDRQQPASVFKSVSRLSVDSVPVDSPADSPAVSTAIEAEQKLPTFRFRISWGGGQKQRWSGLVESKSGRLVSVVPLGTGHDSSTTSLLRSPSQISIKQHTASSYDGFDVVVRGRLDDVLRIQLAPQDGSSPSWERVISVNQLLDGPLNDRLDASGNRITIVRAPGDEIETTFSRPHLIFESGEVFSLNVAANFTQLTNAHGNVRMTVVPARQESPTLWTQSAAVNFDADGSCPRRQFDIPLPTNEGVYDVIIELQRKWFSGSFPNATRGRVPIPGSSAYVIQRRLQLVVLNQRLRENLGSPTRYRSPKAYRSIEKIKPEDVFESINHWRIPKVGNRHRFLNNHRSALLTRDERSWVELAAGGWQAIRIPAEEIGQPHVVEVEYPAHQPIKLGIAIVDRDTAGRVPVRGIDSGIFVPESLVHQIAQPSAALPAEKANVHRIMFWPKSKDSYIFLVNHSREHAASFGAIDVLASPESASAIPVTAAQTDQVTTDLIAQQLVQPSNLAPQRNHRQRLAFYQSASFVDDVGVQKFFDSEIEQPLDDWVVFYQGATRLIEHLKTNHFHGAMISVVSDGSGLYPSQLLRPTPQHDLGVFQSAAQDPVRKDVLRLLLLLFERENLTLVPALTLSGPLASIEAARSSNGRPNSFDLVDYTGKVAPANLTAVPRYSPLDVSVQKGVADIVGELVDRYADVSSIGGVALVCRPDTYSMLPGRQWCYDQQTVRRFFRDSDLTLEDDQLRNPIKVQSLLFGKHQQQWMQWRADQMTNWYAHLAGIIGRSIDQGQLFLAPTDIYRNRELFSAMCPNLHASTDFSRLMLRVGFDRKSLNANANIILLNPQSVSPHDSLANGRADTNAFESKEVQQFFAANDGPTGTVFNHRGRWTHLPQAQLQPPFDQQSGRLMRRLQLTPAGIWNRQRFAMAISQQDSFYLVDGGDSLPRGQSESLKNMMRVFEKLPRVRFNDVSYRSDQSGNQPALATQSVVVRRASIDGTTYFYAVNPSPFPIVVNVGGRVSKDSAGDTDPNGLLESFSDLPFEQIQPDWQIDAQIDAQIDGVADDQTTGQRKFGLGFELPPFGIFGGRFGGAVSVVDYRIEVPSNLSHVLRKKIYKLQAKLNLAKSVSPLESLTNPDFELPIDDSIPGWDTGDQSQASFQWRSKDGYQSQSALLMTSRDQPVWIRSNRFAVPETGRVSITVWVKTESSDKQPPLRIAIEGQAKDSTYYRFGAIGSLATDPNFNQVDSQWRKFAVHFDDLPTPDLADSADAMKLRIGFDLMGPGSVWIDQVRVFDRWFDANDNKSMTQLLASATPLLNQPESFNQCRQILESYWAKFLDQYIDQSKSKPLPEDRFGGGAKSPEANIRSSSRLWRWKKNFQHR